MPKRRKPTDSEASQVARVQESTKNPKNALTYLRKSKIRYAEENLKTLLTHAQMHHCASITINNAIDPQVEGWLVKYGLKFYEDSCGTTTLDIHVEAKYDGALYASVANAMRSIINKKVRELRKDAEADIRAKILNGILTLALIDGRKSFTIPGKVQCLIDRNTRRELKREGIRCREDWGYRSAPVTIFSIH